MWATPSLPMGHRHELMSTAIRCKQRQSAQRTSGLHRYWQSDVIRGNQLSVPMGSTVTGPASSAGGCGEAPSKRAPAHTHTMPCTSTAGSSMSAQHRGHQMQSDAIRCNQMQADASRCKQMRSDAIRCDQMQSDAIGCDQMRSPAPRLPVVPSPPRARRRRPDHCQAGGNFPYPQIHLLHSSHLPY